MNFKVVSAFVFSVSAVLAVACGGADPSADEVGDGDEVSSEEALKANVTPGTFKLYATPNATPHGCDIHTKLDLKAATYSTASLEEVVGGMCMVAVIPNPRTYRLRLAGTSCGSKIYTGSFKKAGKRSEIKITDHRSRMCMDVMPALIVVEETQNGDTTTKYSASAAAPTGQQVTVTGKLLRTFGIGGENTGTSIKEKGGAVTELILDDSERTLFVEGKTARVKGTVKNLWGVETHLRKAIDVSDLLTCPVSKYVDCMPGPNVRLSNLCSGENQSWVTANCPGVTYTF